MSEKEYKAKCENMFARNTVLINENTELEKENERQKIQIEQLSNDNHVLKTAFIIQQAQIEKMKNDQKTAFIKGMRHFAKALKKYDQTEGAWTDYFEHTVDTVLNRELAK